MRAHQVDLHSNDTPPPQAPDVSARRLSVRSGIAGWGNRNVPEEVAVALSYDGSTHAVMMATPSDLDDFALGFSINEGLIAHSDEILELDIVSLTSGIDARMWLTQDASQRLGRRRRSMVGPTGCGLCGIESLAEVARAVPVVHSSLLVTAADIAAAVAGLVEGQRLHKRTRAVHGAAFWTKKEGIFCVREDVGRHNALDKLAGALVRDQRAAACGVLTVTSRLSVEMVQKAARIGAPILVAVSAPTALAIRVADTSGITLVTSARGTDFEVFTHPYRVDHVLDCETDDYPTGESDHPTDMMMASIAPRLEI